MREMSMVEMQEVNGGSAFAVVMAVAAFGAIAFCWSMKKVIDKLKKAGLW